MPSAPMSRRTWLLLIALSVLWGATFVLAGVALRELPPATLVLARVTLAAIALLATLRLLGQPWPIGVRLWAAFLVMGLLNNAIPFTLIFWGQTRIAAGLAAILNATTPLWTVLLARLVPPHEPPGAARLAGVAVGFAGVVLVIGADALGGLGGAVLAQLAVVAAAFSYACAGLFGRRFAAEPPLATAAGQLTASALLLALPVLLVDRPWALAMPGAATLGSVVALALLSTALAYVLYFRILAVAGATNLLLVTLLIPVSALLLGALVLGEAVGLRQLVGMALVGLGLAVIDGRAMTWLSGLRSRPPRPAAR